MEPKANVSVSLGGTTHVFDLMQSPIPCGADYKKGVKERISSHWSRFWYATEVHPNHLNMELTTVKHTVGAETVTILFLANPKTISKDGPITMPTTA